MRVAVPVDGQRHQDDQEAGGPGQGLDDPFGGGPAEHERPAGGDGHAHRLVGGEALQPAGHRRDRHEGRGGEDQGEEEREGHHLGRLAVGGGEPDDREPPRQCVGEEQDERPARPGREGHPVVGRNPTRKPTAVMMITTRMLRTRSALVRPAEHGRAGHGQGPEPLDESLLQVLGQPDAGLHGAEGDRLHEDPGHQVVHVVDPRCRDGATEDVAEQQDEHDRLDGREEQGLGDAGDGEQVALGDGPGVRDGPPGPGRRCRPNGAPPTGSARRWRWS